MTISKHATVFHPLLALFILAALVLPLGASSQAAALEAETDYDVITPPVPQSGTKGSVVEVFNFKCTHCFKLHPHMDKWSGINKDAYNITSLPIYWGKQTDMPIRAYYAAEFLGKGSEMKDAIFKAHFENAVNIESTDELGFLAEEIGLNPEKFKSFLNSFGVSAKIAQAKVQQRVFGVHSTPTLVVNGKYRVSFGKHVKGDPKKLFNIVETLAAQ
jgi:protein dithiol oxidoreductase (disulfide-forming)